VIMVLVRMVVMVMVAMLMIRMGMVIMAMIIVMGMIVIMLARGLVRGVFRVIVGLAVLRMAVIGQGGGCIGGFAIGVSNDFAADPIAMAAAAGIAVTGTAAVAAVLGLFLGFPMRLLLGLDQGLTVGDRNLVIVGMDFAEGQEAVAVAAIFDKGGLERGFYPRDLGKVDITAQLLALGGLEIKLFDTIATDHDDPGLFRVGGIDQHLVGHFETLGGGGRVGPRALDALSADATVHLIRG
jgi:hypothetical protein